MAPEFQSQTVAQDPTAAHTSTSPRSPSPARGPERDRRRADRRPAAVGRAASAPNVGVPGPPDVGQPAISDPHADRRPGRPAQRRDDRHAPAAGPRPPAGRLRQRARPQAGRPPLRHAAALPEPRLRAGHRHRRPGQVGDGRRVAFIHMEIYNQNQVGKGFRPQVAAWRLPTEPWAFVIGSDGRIATRLEGAFSVAELRAAVARVRYRSRPACRRRDERAARPAARRPGQRHTTPPLRRADRAGAG